MENINRFFSGKNTFETVSESDFSQTSDYLEVIRAFARITYSSIYVIDYQSRSFEYVSANPLFLCGYSAEEVKDLGYAFYFQNVKKEDLDLLLTINEAAFSFFENIPLEERKKYVISYDFHLVHKGNSILINHKLTPLFLNEEGKMWKAICVVSLSANHSVGNISISKQDTDEVWKLSIESNKWYQEEKVKLSEREIEILRLYAQGLTINQIAEKIFVSADTVKFHRRKLFDKLNVENITEALAYATNNKLL